MGVTGPGCLTGNTIQTTGDGTVSVKDYSGGKNRLDRKILALRREGDPKAGPPESWRIHDIRRTVATHLAASGIAPHVLASLLNHSPGRTLGITAVYVRHRWLEERRRALESWAGQLPASDERKPDAVQSEG